MWILKYELKIGGIPRLLQTKYKTNLIQSVRSLSDYSEVRNPCHIIVQLYDKQINKVLD